MMKVCFLFASVFASDFFDVEDWDADSDCGQLWFDDENKTTWADCCENKPNDDSCDEKYFPEDECYYAVTTGSNGNSIHAGDGGVYPNDMWTTCCEKNCDDLFCDSAYCKDWQDEVEQCMETWLVIILTIVAILVGCVCLVIILVCCGCFAVGSIGKKKKEERMAAKQNVQQPVIIQTQGQQYNQPQHEGVNFNKLSSSSSENIVIVKHEVHQ